MMSFLTLRTGFVSAISNRLPSQAEWRRSRSLVICGLAFLFAACTALGSASAWIENAGASEVRSRKLQIDTSEQDRLLQFDLDASLFRRLDDRFSNLAVVDASGTLIPSVIEPARENREVLERAEQVATIEKVEEIEGQLVLELSIPERPETINESLAAVQVVTSAVDFDKTVKVEAAETDGSWKVLLEDGLIFDWTRFVNLARYEVSVPATRSRRLRLTLSGATEERRARVREWIGQRVGNEVVSEWERVTIEDRPFRIESVKLVFERRVPREGETLLRALEFEAPEVTVNDSKNQTQIEWSVGRQPISEIDLNWEQRNFSREVEVFVQNTVPLGGVPAWTLIAKDRLSAVDLPEIAERKTQIAFAACRPERMRVIVHDESSSPLTLKSLKARGPAYRGYVLAERGKSDLEIRYGGDPPQNATERNWLAEVRRQVDPLPVSLGPEVAWEEIGGEPEWSRILIWLALGLALLVLTAGLILAMSRSGLEIDESEPPVPGK